MFRVIVFAEEASMSDTNATATPDPSRSVNTRLSARDMLPVLALVLAMFGIGRLLHLFGRQYIIVFSANVSMVTLFLSCVLFLRTRDWRIIPLLLLFL
jgi:hypothetical protein